MAVSGVCTAHDDLPALEGATNNTADVTTSAPPLVAPSSAAGSEPQPGLVGPGFAEVVRA